MVRSSVFHTVIITIVIVLFGFYAYSMMRYLEFEEAQNSDINYIVFTIFLLSLVGFIFSKRHTSTSFSRLWVLWIVWLFVDFYILGLKGKGFANYFIATMGPMCFLLFYSSALSEDRIDRIAIVGFIVLFILALIQNVAMLNLIMLTNVLGEDGAQTNIVYWCLCPFPFLLLVKERKHQILFLLLMGVIGFLTGKRSVFIALTFIYLIYCFYIIRSERSGKKWRSIIFITVVLVAVYFIVNRYMSESLMGFMDRLSLMGEEGDSSMSRIDIYESCFDVMNNNSFIDWLFGRGYETVRILTTHTNAHNDALQMLFEYGIIGLVFYLFMFLFSLKRTLLLRRMKSPYYLGYAASFAIFVVLGLVSNLVVFYSYFAYICALWGLVEARLVQERLIK